MIIEVALSLANASIHLSLCLAFHAPINEYFLALLKYQHALEPIMNTPLQRSSDLNLVLWVMVS